MDKHDAASGKHVSGQPVNGRTA